MTASHAGIYGGESELASYSRFCASVYAREANMKDYDGEDDEDDAQYVSCETNVCMSPMPMAAHANTIAGEGAEHQPSLPRDYVSTQRGIVAGDAAMTHATTAFAAASAAATSAIAAAPAKAATGMTVSSRQRKEGANDDDSSGGDDDDTHNMKSPRHSGWRLVYGFPMINPNSKARTNWDVIIGFCILYSGIFVPLSIAFTPTRRGIGVFGVIELITDFILLCDVCANFRTGFTDAKGTLVMDPKQAYRRYLRTWFLVDLAAALPFDLMLAPISENAYKSTSVQVMRLARLLRFSRLFRSMDKATAFLPISTNVLRMSKLIISISLFAHFDACAMFFAARMDNSSESWIDTNSLVDESRLVQYLWSLFMALSHMLCIGYGPKGNPGTLTELWMTLGSMLIGASLYVILIGLITANLIKNNSGGNNGAPPKQQHANHHHHHHHHAGEGTTAIRDFSASTESTPANSRRGSTISMSQLNSISHHVLLLMSSALLASNSGNGGGGLHHHPHQGLVSKQILHKISAHHDIAAGAGIDAVGAPIGDTPSMSRLSGRRGSI